MKNKILKISFFITAVAALWACAPQVTDDYFMKASNVTLPDSWNVTAVDNSNTLTINFDPCTFIDGVNIIGVQFYCPEASINYVVKNQTDVQYLQKIFKGGDYTLYVAPVTYQGTGVAREIPFKIVKNLLLEHLGTDVLTGQIQVNVKNTSNAITHTETFYTNDLYIEQNSIVTLTGDLANDNVIVNLDFFQRQSTNTVKFLGASGIYSLYWNPVTKIVLIEPSPTSAIASPNYYVFTGPGIGYPTTVSSADIIAAYGGKGSGRYTTWWDPGNCILSRVVMRSTGTNVYQATICINAGATFKPFSNTAWGNDTFAAENCTFTGFDILNHSGDWSPNANLDPTAYYRFTLNSSTKTVDIKKVDKLGNELPNDITTTPTTPNAPIVSNNFDLTTSSAVTIGGELFLSIYHTLVKGDTYTLKDVLADASITYNLDFFQRVSASQVKYLGESGDYHLYYSPTRKIFIIKIDTPDYPGYLVAIGKGFAYPSQVSPYYISAYPQNATSADILQYIPYRNLGNNTYQATVMMKNGSGNLEFKAYHAKGAGKITDNWGNGGQYVYTKCAFTGISSVFADDGTANGNWVAGSNLNPATLYRVTVTVTAPASSANVNVQAVDWNGVVQP